MGDDEDNYITHIARGIPPAYIEDIPGAEAWALVQATTFASHDTIFFSDCLPCILAIHSGRKTAVTSKSPLARPLGLIFDNLGDGESRARNFVWLPVRTSQADVGRKYLNNGKAQPAKVAEA